jgi:hypothetical protein
VRAARGAVGLADCAAASTMAVVGEQAKDVRKRMAGAIFKLALAVFAIGGHDAENPTLPSAVGRAGTYYRISHRKELGKASPYLAFCYFAHCAGRLPELLAIVAQYATPRALASQTERVQLERDLAHTADGLCVVHALKGALQPGAPPLWGGAA